MAPAPIYFPESGAKAIEHSRGDRGTLPGRGRRDRPSDCREDARRLRSDRSPLHPKGNSQEPSRASRRARPGFQTIGVGYSHANAGASEHAETAPVARRVSERTVRSAKILSCVPGFLPAPGALSGPRLSRGAVDRPALARAATGDAGRFCRRFLPTLELRGRRGRLSPPLPLCAWEASAPACVVSDRRRGTQ